MIKHATWACILTGNGTVTHWFMDPQSTIEPYWLGSCLLFSEFWIFIFQFLLGSFLYGCWISHKQFNYNIKLNFSFSPSKRSPLSVFLSGLGHSITKLDNLNNLNSLSPCSHLYSLVMALIFLSIQFLLAHPNVLVHNFALVS